MSKILCERRNTCALNDSGVCAIEPRLDYRAAYVSCLDQVKPIAGAGNVIGEDSIGSIVID